MRLDPATMVRNADAVSKQLLITPNDQLIAKDNITIQFPSRFLSKNIAGLGDNPWAIGVFAVALDTGEYAVFNWMAKVPLAPSSIREVEYQGVAYQEFEFFKGDVICPNINLVLSDTLPYYLYEEMYSTGKYPWFLSELDVLTLFKTTADAAGIRLVSNNATYEMLIAHLTRQTSDRYKVYRHVAAADMTKLIGPEFDIIGLRNVAYGAQDTTSKIMGSYLDEGLTSALISPSDRISTIESIYRKNQS